MGTYTTNYQLYMPTVGETGWGTLVNGNFSTIDTTMKGLDTRLTAVESEVNGNLSCTSVTTSGKITGNGGIVGSTGTFSKVVTAMNVSRFGYQPVVMVLDGLNKTIIVNQANAAYTETYNSNMTAIFYINPNPIVGNIAPSPYICIPSFKHQNIGVECSIVDIKIIDGLWGSPYIAQNGGDNGEVVTLVNETLGWSITVPSYSASTPLYITMEEAITLLNTPSTITAKYNGNTFRVGIYFKNMQSTINMNQHVYSVPYGTL